LSEIFRKLGFTKRDIVLILFLLSAFAAGLIIKYAGWNNKKDFDYSSSDRSFEQYLNSSYTQFDLSQTKQERLKLLNRINDSLTAENEITNNETPISLPVGKKLNINLAYPADLELLPGVGKVTAERIIEYRERKSGFKNIEDLMNVKGIGQKKFDRIKGYITVADDDGK
jgi:competence ComEA-like helix-hairpin-helix protein